MVGLCTGESCAALERLAMVEGESASIPWTHILVAKVFISNRNKVLNAYS